LALSPLNCSKAWCPNIGVVAFSEVGVGRDGIRVSFVNKYMRAIVENWWGVIGWIFFPWLFHRPPWRNQVLQVTTLKFRLFVHNFINFKKKPIGVHA